MKHTWGYESAFTASLELPLLCFQNFGAFWSSPGLLVMDDTHECDFWLVFFLVKEYYDSKAGKRKVRTYDHEFVYIRREKMRSEKDTLTAIQNESHCFLVQLLTHVP